MNAERKREVNDLLAAAREQRKMGNREAALAAFQAAAGMDAANSAIDIDVACELRALDRLDEADALLGRVLVVKPQSLAALIERGHLGRRRGDHATSLQAFEAASRVAPQHLGVKIEIARTLRALERPEEADAAITSVLATDERFLPALIEQGHVRRRKSDQAGAVAAFEAAAAVDPSHAGVRFELSTALVELARERWGSGDPAEAQHLLREALDRQPDHLSALVLSAELALLAERPEEALKCAESAIASHPRQLGLYLLAARAAAALPDRAMADRFIDEARGRFGGTPEVLAAQIHIFRAFRDVTAVSSVMAESPDAKANPAIWAESVSAAIASGDFAAAEVGLATPPKDSRRDQARVHFLRARLAEGKRDYGAAVARYGEALAIDPSDAGWHSELARASMLVLDIDGARSQLREAIERNLAATIARGQSLNPSQHHIGQILDEFALDEAVLAKLRAALSLPLDEQVDAFAEVTRAAPDNTGASLMLLVAMRRTGRFRYVQPQFGRLSRNRIPKRVIQFWDTESPPPDVSELMASWDGRQSGFQHLVFHEASAAAYLAGSAPPEIARAFKRAEHPAQRADIFRLAYLAREGGVYVDADDRRVAPLDILVPKGAMFVSYQEDYGTLANNFLAAAPAHPVIRRALDLAVVAVNRGDRDTVWLSTGPGLMTRAFAQLLTEPSQGNWLERTLIRELYEMHGLVEIHCPAAYKRTDRHWSRASSAARPVSAVLQSS